MSSAPLSNGGDLRNGTEPRRVAAVSFLRNGTEPRRVAAVSFLIRTN